MRKLVTIGILLVATTAISQIAVTNIPVQNVDVQQRINNIIGRYRKVEERGTKYDKENPPSQNWGGLVRAGAHLLNSLGDIGDRAALPFLEELAISTNSYDFVRERSTANYVKIATPNESIALAHILLQEDIRKVSSWRFDFLLQFLKKYDEAILSGNLSANTKTDLFSVLFKYICNPVDSSEARIIDNFLTNHCPSYVTSKQRLAMSKNYIDSDNEKVAMRNRSIKDNIEILPPSKRYDLRKQFPDLPPLPSEEERGMMWVYGVVVFALVSVVTVLGLKYYKNHLQTKL